MQNEREYSSALSEAATEDFSDLDQLGFLSVPGGRDKEGRQVVMVAAKNYPARVLKTDRVFRSECETPVASWLLSSCPLGF